jgi:hypothetical protein
MKKLYSLLFLVFTSLSFGQVITQWNFDSSTTTPSTGTGTVTLIGGVLENIQTTCNCSFVSGNPATGKAYSSKTYPAQGTASGTAGAQFNVSTIGQTNINVYVDVYGSGTASKYVLLQYTTDGTTWVDSGTATILPYTTASQWVTLSGAMPSTAENNANFAFRVVTVFDPTASGTYSAVNSTKTYAVTGTIRFDNVTVSSGVMKTNEEYISGLKIYPNPVSNGTLFVESDSNIERTITIFDVLGKQVLNTTTSNTVINVSTLNSGVYMLKVTEEGKTATKKLVIR